MGAALQGAKNAGIPFAQLEGISESLAFRNKSLKVLSLPSKISWVMFLSKAMALNLLLNI